VDDIFIRLYVSFFRSGLAAELGSQRAITLLAVASYMDEDGDCCPSQETLARDLGVSVKTVYKYIGELTRFTWEGKPVLTRDKKRVPVPTGQYKEYTIYRVQPGARIAIFDSPDRENDSHDRELNSPDLPTNYINVNNSNNSNTRNIANRGRRPDPDPQPKPDLAEFPINNSSDVCKYFAGRYQEKYGVPYLVNWKREASMVKTKLWGIYSSGQLRAIIDEVIENYDTRWGSREYPRPSIGQLCSWLANKAMASVQEREKKEADLERRMEAGRSWENDERLERWLC
jgi:hypothetical protein